MPPNPTFSPYKVDGATKIPALRKVAHSALQSLKSRSGLQHAGHGLDKTALAAGTINAASTIAMAVPAVAAGCAAGFLTIASGPFAAGALGFVALLLAAKSTYSNREKAHETLQPYVWSFIDDEPPKPFEDDKTREKVGAAAMSLICDGQAQQMLMDGKLQMAESAFKEFLWNYSDKSKDLDKLVGKTKEQMLNMEHVVMAALRQSDDRNKLLEKAFSKGGAVYDYMRRLVHTANYMQAPMIVGKALQKDKTPLGDLADSVPMVRDVRKLLRDIHSQVERHNDAFDKATQSLPK